MDGTLARYTDLDPLTMFLDRNRPRSRGRLFRLELPSRALLVVVAVLPWLWACSGSDAGQHLEVPAGPGSGQPHLDADGQGVWMSWTEPWDGGHRVALSYFDGRWRPAATIAQGDGFFVNWADFPSVSVVGDRLVAHWLRRGGRGTYDYGVRVSMSDDWGETWSRAVVPHENETPTEHGFVSVFAWRGEPWMAWLDGRAMVQPGGAMSVRARMLSRDGDVPVSGPGRESIVDDRSCECCQTAAVVADGVPVVVFRDRSAGEVRDIYVSRLVEDPAGVHAWSPGVPVARDEWIIGGCPVNGPAAAASGGDVAVAWFTAPDNVAQVNVAFSDDRAESFSSPWRLDEGDPLGRVDIEMLDDRSVVVTWLERSGGSSGTKSVIASRRVAPGGRMSGIRRLAETVSARASGFPRMARLGTDRLLFAWTDATGEGRVRAMVMPLSAWEVTGQ